MSYDDCLNTEAKAKALLTPFLLDTFGGCVWLDKNRRAAELQQYGDVVVQVRTEDGAFETWDVKAEEKFTGNFFIEAWSNRSRDKKGWFYTSKASHLAYVFLDRRRLFMLDLDLLRAVPIVEHCGLRRQNKHDQLNDTWGHTVPIKTLERLMPVSVTDLRPYDNGGQKVLRF